MAKATDTSRDPIVDAPVVETAPEPGKVKVTDAAGNEVWVWPVDAHEIAAAAGTVADISTKIPEDATRPPVEDVIEAVFPHKETVVEEVLPDDYPHIAYLREGGVSTRAHVQKHIADGTLTGIPNVGAGRAAEIEKAEKVAAKKEK